MTNLEEIELYEINTTDLSIFLEMENFPSLRRIILFSELKEKNSSILEQMDLILKERQESYIVERKVYSEIEQGEHPLGGMFPPTIEEMKEYGVYLE